MGEWAPEGMRQIRRDRRSTGGRDWFGSGGGESKTRALIMCPVSHVSYYYIIPHTAGFSIVRLSTQNGRAETGRGSATRRTPGHSRQFVNIMRCMFRPKGSKKIALLTCSKR